MVHYHPTLTFAQHPPPSCPGAATTGPEIVGLSGDGGTVSSDVTPTRRFEVKVALEDDTVPADVPVADFRRVIEWQHT